MGYCNWCASLGRLYRKRNILYENSATVFGVRSRHWSRPKSRILGTESFESEKLTFFRSVDEKKRRWNDTCWSQNEDKRRKSWAEIKTITCFRDWKVSPINNTIHGDGEHQISSHWEVLRIMCIQTTDGRAVTGEIFFFTFSSMNCIYGNLLTAVFGVYLRHWSRLSDGTSTKVKWVFGHRKKRWWNVTCWSQNEEKCGKSWSEKRERCRLTGNTIHGSSEHQVFRAHERFYGCACRPPMVGQ